MVALCDGDIMDALPQLAQPLIEHAIALDVFHFAANFLIEPIQFAPLSRKVGPLTRHLDFHVA